MSRCVIISGYIEGSIRKAAELREDDYIICADAGLEYALRENITPALFIGDRDSCTIPFAGESIILPTHKDDTDTVAALHEAKKRGYRECLIIGAIGGRLDQTVATLQTLAGALDDGMTIIAADERNTAQMLKNGSVTLAAREGFTLSLFSQTSVCRGVCEKGVEYPLENAELNCSYPLGVSNRITSDFAEISVREGTLLIVRSRED